MPDETSSLVGISLGADGFYQAVAPQGAITIDNSSSPANAPLVLVGPWIYVTGDQPRAQNDKLQCGAEGSSIILQHIDATGSSPGISRVIMLDGDSGFATLKSDGVTTVELEAGQYVDCYEGTPTFFGPPATFDEDNPPAGSADLMESVDAARRSWRVS